MADVEEVVLHATSWYKKPAVIGRRAPRDLALPTRRKLHLRHAVDHDENLGLHKFADGFYEPLVIHEVEQMPYPLSPFAAVFDAEMLLRLASDVPSEMIRIQNGAHLEELLKWLCTSPKVTSFRVNTLTHSRNDVEKLLARELVKKFPEVKAHHLPVIDAHPLLPEVILLHGWDEKYLDLEIKSKAVVVDVNCAAAVLRGAHIFAPGVMGMLSGTKIDDEVSIYADLSGKCKKGLQKLYDCPKKLFLGNGIAKMVRHQLYGKNVIPTGVAVQVTATISRCPSIGDDCLPKGSAVLQNLPSILCSHALNPKPGSVVLDMCASPGNKTTHIAALMENKGILIAIDKTPAKVKQLKSTCDEYQAKVHIFQADSTKIINKQVVADNESVLKGPPFPEETFDRILLDAPCSALGKRPQLSNNVTEKVVKSYVPLQRKLFENAVHLLKVDGHLLYSTCTITLAENEGMVAWALKTFTCLELRKADLCLGGPGLDGTSLTEAQLACVQRFGPEQETDSVGFFLALFVKKNKL